MAKIGQQALKEVNIALEHYETEVKRSKLRPVSKRSYLIHARQFVRWIEDDFAPGGTL